jgi:hypothetical protein
VRLFSLSIKTRLFWWFRVVWQWQNEKSREHVESESHVTLSH